MTKHVKIVDLELVFSLQRALGLAMGALRVMQWETADDERATRIGNMILQLETVSDDFQTAPYVNVELNAELGDTPKPHPDSHPNSNTT